MDIARKAMITLCLSAEWKNSKKNDRLLKVPNYDQEIQRRIAESNSQKEDTSIDWANNLFDVNPDVLKFFMYLIVFVFLCIMAWFIYNEFKGVETKPKRKQRNPFAGGLQGTAEDANIKGHDFPHELDAALRDGNYALAVNLRYLMALTALNEQSRIKWMEYKTPLMYVAELNEKSQELESLTMRFLYIKYGHYPADENVYLQVVELYNTITAPIVGQKGGEQ